MSSDTVRRGSVLRGDVAALFTDSKLMRQPLEAQRWSSGVDPKVVEEAVAEGRRHGHAEGYGTGLAEGRRKGREIAEGNAAQAALALQTSMEALESAVEQVRARDEVSMRSIEEQVSRLAFELAEALIGRELELSASPVRDAVARALKLVPPTGSAIVRVNPVDADSIGVVAELAPSRELRIVPDPTVEAGGCVLEAGATTIDAQLGPALARVRAALCGEGA